MHVSLSPQVSQPPRQQYKNTKPHQVNNKTGWMCMRGGNLGGRCIPLVIETFVPFLILVEEELDHKQIQEHNPLHDLSSLDPIFQEVNSFHDLHLLSSFP